MVNMCMMHLMNRIKLGKEEVTWRMVMRKNDANEKDEKKKKKCKKKKKRGRRGTVKGQYTNMHLYFFFVDVEIQCRMIHWLQRTSRLIFFSRSNIYFINKNTTYPDCVQNRYRTKRITYWISFKINPLKGLERML